MLALAGSATTIPAGSVSVKRMTLATVPLSELSMVKVRVLRPPNSTVAGSKLLLKPGRSISTISMSVAVPLLPKVELRAPEVLVWVVSDPSTASAVDVDDDRADHAGADHAIAQADRAAAVGRAHGAAAGVGDERW